MTALVAAHEVAFWVGAKSLVRDVTLDVEAGRVTVVIGPNGAGKSTLVKLLSGEARPSAGRVTYCGEAVDSIPPWRLACLRAVLPQASPARLPVQRARRRPHRPPTGSGGGSPRATGPGFWTRRWNAPISGTSPSGPTRACPVASSSGRNSPGS